MGELLEQREDLERGEESARVLQLQHDLIAVGLPPKGGADGKLGPRTLATVDEWRINHGRRPLQETISALTVRELHAAAEFRRQVPSAPEPEGDFSLGAWIDRTAWWDPGDMIELAVGLVDAVSLFIHGLDDAKGSAFGTFRPLDVLEDITHRYVDAGLEAHWTTWLNNKRAWLKDFEAKLLKHLAGSVVGGLHLDLEGPFSDATDAEVEFAADMLASHLKVVYVTDYASVQAPTVKLVRALVERGVQVVLVPQAYSVAYTNYGGHKVTKKGTYHWPGVTQTEAMISRRWGQLAALEGTTVEMGVAAYKQSFEGLTPAQSMAIQLRAAREASNGRAWMWSLEMTRRVREAVLRWKANSVGVR